MGLVCVSCGRPSYRRRHASCARAYRQTVDYRRRALARDGSDCARCSRLTNRIVCWVNSQLGRTRRVEVDHIVRIIDGGSHDGSNLQILCRRHHRRKTARENGRRRRRRVRLPFGVTLLATLTVVVVVAGPDEDVVTAGTAGLTRPETWLAAAVLAVAGLLLWCRFQLRRQRRLRLWTALQAVLHIPDGRGRRLSAGRWRWQQVGGWLPRYQPSRLILRHRGVRLDETDRDRLEQTVSDMLGIPYRGVWQPTRDRARFEPVPPLPDLVGPALHAGDDRRLTFGLAEDGPAVWDVTAAPHCLVVGPTGSGKTSALRAMADQALQAGWGVAVADPKRIELRGLRARTISDGYATGCADMLGLVRRVKAEMDYRYVLLEAGEQVGLQPLLLIVDEVAELVGAAREEWRSPSDGGRGRSGDPPLLTDLASLARLGRSARVHLLVGIQRPDARYVTGEARDQYGCRLVCGPMSRDGSRMVFGDSVTARTVEPVPGRGLVQVGGGVPRRVQVAWVPDQTVPMLPTPTVEQPEG